VLALFRCDKGVHPTLDRPKLALVVAAHELEKGLVIAHVDDPARHRLEPSLLGGERPVVVPSATSLRGAQR
jgi:hypothetical protein